MNQSLKVGAHVKINENKASGFFLFMNNKPQRIYTYLPDNTWYTRE